MFEELLVPLKDFSFQKGSSSYENAHYQFQKHSNSNVSIWKTYLYIPKSFEVVIDFTIYKDIFHQYFTAEEIKIIQDLYSKDFSTLKEARLYTDKTLKPILLSKPFLKTDEKSFKIHYTDSNRYFSTNLFYPITVRNSPIKFTKELDSQGNKIWRTTEYVYDDIGQLYFKTRPQALKAMYEYVEQNLYDLYQQDKPFFSYYQKYLTGKQPVSVLNDEYYSYWWLMFVKPDVNLKEVFK